MIHLLLPNLCRCLYDNICTKWNYAAVWTNVNYWHPQPSGIYRFQPNWTICENLCLIWSYVSCLSFQIFVALTIDYMNSNYQQWTVLHSFHSVPFGNHDGLCYNTHIRTGNTNPPQSNPKKRLKASPCTAANTQNKWISTHKNIQLSI